MNMGSRSVWVTARKRLRRWLPRGLALAFSVAVPLVAWAQDPAPTVLHLLDYIAVDYAEAVADGKITNANEYAEMREFGRNVRTLIAQLPARPAGNQLLADATALIRAIETKAPAAQIAAQASALRWAVIDAYQLTIAPRRPPDLARGAALYEAQCAMCHGKDGHGDGAAGRSLDPAPSNFHDTERMANRSVHGLYNTITLGVAGTGMASYSHLGEDDRWALAFHVANFAASENELAAGAALWSGGRGRGGFADLNNVATLSANETRARFGADGAAMQVYLRAHPEALAATKPTPLTFATNMIDQSLSAYRAGRRAEAMQLAVQAYLEGFELVESGLGSVDADLTARTEREMMAYREMLQAGAPIEHVEARAATIRQQLALASEKLDGARLSPATTFVSALVILVREGAEAILVVAAILAFLARAGRGEARRYVHAGWVAALGLGVVTWLVSNYVVQISGAGRELTEGVTALVAAAMLLYVGYWLHSKSHSAAWQKYIRDKIGGVLSRGTVWTLALISFLAVYREAFETVLFYQTLAVQAGPGGRGALLMGLFVGAALLVAVAWAILRASVRLPVGLFFSASSAILVILAIVFTGQGIAALQEAGKVGVNTVAFIAVPVLGIYPTLQTLAAQTAVVALSVIGVWWASRAARAAAGGPGEDTAAAR